MKKILSIAVRALVEYTLRSGDLVSEFQGSIRAAEGSRIHRKIQKSRPEEYRAEVSISRQHETDEFSLEIRGRIDGVYTYPDRVVIDEIKSTTKDPDVLEREEHPLHWGQLKCYAYLYALQEELEDIEGQLTYYQVDSGETRELKRHFSRDELEAFFQDLVQRYLEWAATLEAWYGLRDASIEALDFPFASYRPGQRRMAESVYRAIRDKTQLLAQAPTGIGKTLAALFPAIKAIGEKKTCKIFYLTARTTGRSVAEQSLRVQRDKGLRLKALTITAKDKVCFRPESACNGEECEFARGYFDRVNEGLESIFSQDSWNRDTIEEAARQFTLCPFEFSLGLSLWADCVICDYNYAFDPRVYLKRFFLEIQEDYCFLVDEAHNLVDRSREMFSAEIYKQPFLDLRRTLKERLPKLYKQMGKINTCLLEYRKLCEEHPDRKLSREGDFRVEKDAPETLLPLLREFLKLAEVWLAQNIQSAFRAALLDLYFEIHQFIRISEQYDEAYVSCFEKDGSDLRLKLFCLDPSRLMADALQRCRSAIFFSATLTPLDYFHSIFGCDESAGRMMLASPFPPENLCLLVADRISTYYRQREKTKGAVAQAIASAIWPKTGNYLLFFPSYHYMRMVADSFAGQNPDTTTIIQTPGMTEAEREEFLDRFSHENQETLLGFAVMGGIFGEGIDLVGDRLSGTVITGVGLPGISPERELIKDHFAQTQGAGFEFAYLYPGINRVLQAAGRVIRSEHDRGVVLLIDQRFSTPRYTRLFPQEWRPVKVRNQKEFDTYLQEFWGDQSYG
ncbi:MAG: DEAD/DEAH box helicase [bacterium]|nr:DEAD/DEAH box helicase [bacterium]